MPLTFNIVKSSVSQVFLFLLLVLIGVALLELYLYLHFKLAHSKRLYVILSFIIGIPLIFALVFLLFKVYQAKSFYIPRTNYPVLSKLLIIVIFAELLIFLAFRYIIKTKYQLPFMLIAPGLIAAILLIIYPFFFEVRLAFGNLNLYTVKKWLQTGELGFVGFRNFYNVFTQSPLHNITFFQLLLRTILWVVINVTFHVAGGMAIALLLNRPMKGRGIYRTLIVVPWAMPQIVAVLAWRGEFHATFGFINIMLGRIAEALPFLQAIGFGPLPWRTNPFWIFVMVCIVNIWLGIPFMAVIILGGLQSISSEYYEAAEIDGASGFQRFLKITLPLLRPVLIPAIILGVIWTFNQVNVIFLMTGQAGGQEHADILVSALYKSAFMFYRYSYSAAFALICFVILFIFAAIWIKVSRVTEGMY
jgi:arabinogalactan oligomer/maltooligosaccharide transport system permease protein